MAVSTDPMAKHITRRAAGRLAPSPPITISIDFVHGMISGLQARGRSCAAPLAEAGVSPELLKEPGARVTSDQYTALFRLLIERFDDECLGFLSRPLRRGSFALMTQAATEARDFETAIRRIGRVFRLLQDDLRLELRREGELAGLALCFDGDGGGKGDVASSVATLPFLHELLVRTLWRLLAWLAGGKLPVERFDFAFARPPYAASYERVFPSPLRFGCEVTAFWLDASLLARTARRDAASMHAFLANAQAQIVAPRRGDAAFGARVRSHLQLTQPRWPDLISTAAALHTSTSTLQRRLAREATSFQSLKDELRRDTAIVRLSSSGVSLSALASELGFADGSAFQRAFKTWTGSAPGAYRSNRP